MVGTKTDINTTKFADKIVPIKTIRDIIERSKVKIPDKIAPAHQTHNQGIKQPIPRKTKKIPKIIKMIPEIKP